MKNAFILACTAILPLALQACSGESEASETGLSGSVAIDGSSTVFPITEAVAEEFRSVEPRVRVTVGVSGTGGGFKKFILGETDISDASRYVKESEVEALEAAKRDFIELPVAYDGLAIVVNKSNDFAKTMTVAELAKMWRADSTAKNWSDIREGWPERPFKLFAPGQDSGTFDYFTEAVNGKSGNCRADATFSEDDNTLVTGIAGSPDGIGFFGIAYYMENQAKLNLVAVDGGTGPITPTMETISNGTYAPLSRPLFIYVAKAAKDKPQVEAFVNFYLDNMAELAEDVGYVAFPAELGAAIKKRYENGVTGTTREMKGSLLDLYKN
ncbi:MAG: PstS family phosphate ABC transporter substrate-binding protein [Planctomycetota bacterium]|jgi:phosphate transport system substrate-binding protein